MTEKPRYRKNGENPLIRLYINMWNMIYKEAVSIRIDAAQREIMERAYNNMIGQERAIRPGGN